MTFHFLSTVRYLCAVLGMSQIGMFVTAFTATPKTIMPLFAGLQSLVSYVSTNFNFAIYKQF